MDKGGGGYCRGRAASYRPSMAKPYRSRIDSRNHRSEANAARRNQSEPSGIAAALVSAKDAAKAMLGF
jgi:hypothetical protein